MRWILFLRRYFQFLQRTIDPARLHTGSVFPGFLLYLWRGTCSNSNPLFHHNSNNYHHYLASYYLDNRLRAFLGSCQSRLFKINNTCKRNIRICCKILRLVVRIIKIPKHPSTFSFSLQYSSIVFPWAHELHLAFIALQQANDVVEAMSEIYHLQWNSIRALM